jgi:beta-galactosidase
MFFGVDYYPEQWVFPYGGTADNPESQWELDAELMAKAGFNVVRMGDYSWGICEPEEGNYNFDWLERVMDIMAKHDIKVVLGTPTGAPPLWLAKKYPQILPVDDQGRIKHEGTRRAACLNNDIFWNAAKQLVEHMARALGNHSQVIAWQIDSGLGGHQTEWSFNEDSKLEWQNWLKLKYKSVDRLNRQLGLRFWSQTVTAFDQVPMPMHAPTMHNPALLLDWHRFCSDTLVAFTRMQAEVLHEICPNQPVTVNLRALQRRFDHFDMADVVDFISVESNAAIKAKSAELACDIDILRSLKKTDIRMPDGDVGFWVIEQKAGQVNWQDVNSLVRPGIIRLFTYQLISRGACGVLFYRWRQPRIGNEQFFGAVLPHHISGNSRVYKEISQIGEELKMLSPALQGTKVTSDVCILYSHENDWALSLPNQPNKHFNLREHIQLFYNAFHDRNLQVDFAKPTEDLSHYKIVIAPSLHLLSSAEADNLKLYVQNGGVLIGTFNTGLVDQYHIAPDTGLPCDLTELFGLEVLEFDPLPPQEENHLTFKGAFPTSHLHPARLWCDVIEARGCQILATFAKDFYAGKPAITMNNFGLGKAIYIGTQSHQHFYHDLVAWLRQMCAVQPLLKVPENVEVSMRQKDDNRVFFLLNHQNSPVRIQFYKPMHDYLTGNTFSGNYDLPPFGVLVLDEHTENKMSGVMA